MAATGKNFYITTTLPYINAEPHLGFALEIVQADVIARYHRQQGETVFFNTGTDEHGLKIYRKAAENELTPQEFCDRYSKKFKDLKEALTLSYDNFIRTTDVTHIKAAQAFWQRCQERGDIYKKNYKIKYCVGCEMEKKESELVKGRCPIHPNQRLEIIEEENYFFRYAQYQERLKELYNQRPDFVLPASRFNEIKEFTSQGLADFSISRLREKMPWGIPVPGDDSQTIYVWFDALVNYIAALGWPDNQERFNSFWPGLQVAGKDNLRQQSSMWQAMLMSAGLAPSQQIFIHGFITANGQKMSKSLGNVVNPFDLVETYSTDALRYFLLREITPGEDGDFTRDKFEKRYNDDLASGLGNLLARVTTLAAGQQGDKAVAIKDDYLREQVDRVTKESQTLLASFRFNESLALIWRLISLADKYIEEKKPWQAEEDREAILNNCLALLKEVAHLLQIFLPTTAEQMKKQLVQPKKGEPLFPRI